MNFYQKKKLKVIIDYILGWTLALVFLSIIRGVGTRELGSLEFRFLPSMIISFTMGPILGLVSGLSQVWMEEKIYRRISIRQFLLLRLLYAFLFVIALILIAYAIYNFFFGVKVDLISYTFGKGTIAIYLYVLLVDSFLNILRQINMMLGTGNLGKFLTGKFYHPREEDRIFMFLDLQSSTEIAEKLGHIKYSSLIQDCFNDLGIVVEDGAEIYQYVGDEAVLTWKFEEGIENANCVNAFFRFKSLISRRKEHYEELYGIIPFFKAGLHGGKVTVTEIGKYKKEIAYHGDPINTAARIQGQCNVLGKEFLLSKDLADRLISERFEFREVGSIQLKGKQREIDILSVSEKE